MISRSLSRCAVVIFACATSASIVAQDLRDRELRPAFDFTTIQMPVEIVSIKLSDREIQPGDKIKGGDDWLQGLSFTLKNVSDKAIAYVAVSLRFDSPPSAQPRRVVVFVLSYGVDYSRREPRRASSPSALQPGETVDLILTKERYANFLEILRRGDIPPSFDVAPYFVERVSFEDDPDVIWEAGHLKRRDPTTIGRFNVMEHYVLPTRQK